MTTLRIKLISSTCFGLEWFDYQWFFILFHDSPLFYICLAQFIVLLLLACKNLGYIYFYLCLKVFASYFIYMSSVLYILTDNKSWSPAVLKITLSQTGNFKQQNFLPFLPVPLFQLNHWSMTWGTQVFSFKDIGVGAYHSLSRSLSLKKIDLTPHGMWDLNFLTRDQTGTLYIGR